MTRRARSFDAKPIGVSPAKLIRLGRTFVLLVSCLFNPIGFGTGNNSVMMAAEADAAQSLSNGTASNETFIAVAKSAQTVVVNVFSTREVQEGADSSIEENPFFEDPLFKRFFGDRVPGQNRSPQSRREQALGSGVIVSSDGYIVTNNHVVEEADQIKVLLADKRSFDAKVIGTDPKTDVAVIKISATNLPILPWGDSGKLHVGEMVLAVGNPFGLNQTVTMGIVSAVGRAHMGIVDYEDFIQTDAAINPGNSGGALVNLNGELIGINTAIFSRSGGYMGIGFAIPSNMVKSVMDSLIKTGKVVRGWLGVSIQDVTEDLAKEFGAPSTKGALVGDVVQDGPGDKAGLRRGDIVTALNEMAIKDAAHLQMLVSETAPGTTVTLSVWREKRSRQISVTLGEQRKERGGVASAPETRGQGQSVLAGVAVETLSAEDARRLHLTGGVVVTEVLPDSPADRAGLRPDDVIREINRKPVRSLSDFERRVGALSPRSRVLLLITRGRGTIFLSLQPE
jgi:serine protease Do